METVVMKTFDEAIAELQSKSEISKDIFCSNYIKNEAFQELIMSSASDIMGYVLQANMPTKALVDTITELHIIFQMGVIVGMKMEKSDAL